MLAGGTCRNVRLPRRAAPRSSGATRGAGAPLVGSEGLKLDQAQVAGRQPAKALVVQVKGIGSCAVAGTPGSSWTDTP